MIPLQESSNAKLGNRRSPLGGRHDSSAIGLLGPPVRLLREVFLIFCS